LFFAFLVQKIVEKRQAEQQQMPIIKR